jgi:hypothetical protein
MFWYSPVSFSQIIIFCAVMYQELYYLQCSPASSFTPHPPLSSRTGPHNRRTCMKNTKKRDRVRTTAIPRSPQIVFECMAVRAPPPDGNEVLSALCIVDPEEVLDICRRRVRAFRETVRQSFGQRGLVHIQSNSWNSSTINLFGQLFFYSQTGRFCRRMKKELIFSGIINHRKE